MYENIIIQELTYEELLTKAKEAIEQKNYFLAINIYMYLHNNNPSEISYAHNLGNLFYLINDFNKSISYYLYSSGLDKNNPFYYAQISILYNYLGDNIKALYYYKKAIEIDENYFDKYINDL